MTGIYVLENKFNGNLYVGQSVNIENRMRCHKSSSHNMRVIDRAINKYGWGAFNKYTFEAPENILNAAEIEVIQRLNSLVPKGYNIATGGESGTRGFKHTEESKKKMRESSKGQVAWNKGGHLSEETKKKLSLINKGKTHSEETKYKISEAMTGKHAGRENPFFGKHHTEEVKRKISQSCTGLPGPNKGKVMSAEQKEKISLAMSGEKHHMFGKKHSIITKQKISRNHADVSGDKNPMYGKAGPNKGKQLSSETREKISKSKKIWWADKRSVA